MKNIFKFLICLLCIFLIIGLVYFILIYMKDDNNSQINESQNPSLSQNPSSSQKPIQIDIEDVKNEIDNVIKLNDESEVRKEITDSVSEDILDKSAKEYIEFFGEEALSTTVILKDNSIILVPAPDFVNIEHFHYSTDGNLIAYILEYSGIGGKITYYFNNRKLIDTVSKVEELDNISIEYEKEQDILEKATKVYNKYVLEKNN